MNRAALVAAIALAAGGALWMRSAWSSTGAAPAAPAIDLAAELEALFGDSINAAVAQLASLPSPVEYLTDAVTELETIMQPAPADPNAAARNVAAFLLMIRDAEGTAGPEGYRTMFGGGLFDSFADHPRVAVTARLGGRPITSTAAGAYQFLATTWDECRRALNLADFSPASQDAAAVYLIRRRGALADVQAGRFDAAVQKVAREWASMPGSPYGQPVKSLAHVRTVYLNAGGALA